MICETGEKLDSVGLGKRLRSYLAESREESVVLHLPTTGIEVRELVISRAVTLLGSPGSSLILKDKPILIKEGGSLHLSETTVEAFTSKFAFEVHSASELSLTDCAVSLRSDSTEAIGVHLCSEGARLKATASSFAGFFAHVLCGRDSLAIIRNCSFTSCSNSSILAINPLLLEIKDSVLKDCGESSVEIRFTFEDSAVPEEKRVIYVKGNTLTGSRASGLIVCADKVAELDFLELLVEGNAISATGQEGIVLRNITFYKQVIISSNDVSKCGHNGISIVSSYPTSKHEIAEIVLEKNRVNNCEGAGVSVCDALCKIIECDITSNDKCGIFLTNMKTSTPELNQVLIAKSIISANRGNGLFMTDSKGSRVFLDDNRIERNKKAGVVINRCVVDDKPSSSQATGKSSHESGKISIRRGKVKHNKQNGLEIAHSSLFIDSVTVKSNVGYALKLEGNYREVKYSTKTLRAKNIVGPIISNGKLISIYHRKSPCASCTII
eukprot:TRINITY_DN9504_c0_g1_i13.p1 TRINITY_DN9504_c0_g1~~TRINITY_DN9504_c0_g1_i13.p1  ORF type:complete len:496 (-),score=107.59 TRINITY_DN9504_c0_g1_i13:131-1618(-)